jgi:hypothetical protein
MSTGLAAPMAATISFMGRRVLLVKAARSERFWVVLLLTAFSASAASSAVREMGRWPLLAVVSLVVALVLIALLFGEVRAQGSLRVSAGSRWTVRAIGSVLVLGGYAVLTLAAAVLGYAPAYERLAAAVVGPVYAALCAYYVWLRCRTLPDDGARSRRACAVP